MARRDQQLAVVSWKLVESLDPDVRPEFRSRAVSLGPMLISSGLAATAAFHEAKAGPAAGNGTSNGDGNGNLTLKRAYRALSDGLAQHVLHHRHATGRDLVIGVGSMRSADYRSASADARAFALWVRRAAEALIPPAGSESDRDTDA